MLKNPPAEDIRDAGLTLGEKIPWRRAWLPLQYSGLGNPMDRAPWGAPAHRVAKSQTEVT